MRRDSRFPKPVSYRRALRVLYMREEPWAHFLRKNGDRSKIVRYLKARAAVRIVADIFGVTPLHVAQHLLRVGGKLRRELDLLGTAFAKSTGATPPEGVMTENRLYWSTGRGAW